ncbi:MAG: FG-GAP-like repeat-containing protein [Saprospiraceae bacterium]
MNRNLPVVILSCVSVALFSQNTYQDISAVAGIQNTGGKNRGVAIADYDNDGDEDVYAFTRQGENQLFQNLGNNTFVNVAPAAGVNNTGSTNAAVWGDLNNDGWPDLYVANYQGADVLYVNNGPGPNGTVTFTDITIAAGISNVSYPISVHMADVDNDGLLDIYVANFLAQNKLYHNNGNLSFTDQVFLRNATDASLSMGCIFFDFDNDGDQDLYLVHDGNVPNILYQNDGTGHFMNVAVQTGSALAAQGMGVDVADVNRDGWPDLYITNLGANALLLNNGDGTFSDITTTAGVGDTGMGWGTLFLDFDNDGWVDLYAVNDSHFSPKPNVLYRNNGDNTFTIVEADGPVSSMQGGYGGASLDIDGDGALDIFIANSGNDEGNQLFKNAGNNSHWIGFKLTGSESNKSAIGAKVTIEYGDGEKQKDEINAGSGFAGQNPARLYFGLNDKTSVQKATIHWPSGLVEDYTNLAADQLYHFTETSLAAPPVINSLTPLAASVEKWGKFEVGIALTATFSNPYDYDEIAVTATFTGPSGQQKSVDGFFMQDYDLVPASGSLMPTGNGKFKVRFSPDEIGTWSFAISVTDSIGTTTSAIQNFDCVEVGSPNNHGFVRTNMSNYLNFDDGQPYIPIGENMAWQINNPYLDYKDWLESLASNGGNFMRLWHAHWGLGLEWENGNNSFQGLRNYKQTNCFYQDWLFDYCAENGIYVMLALQHHGPVSTQVNPNWDESPYNAANGGPCQNTWDFFSNGGAKADTKNRLRYIVARWGYARSILCWELFNEVVWTDDFANRKGEVADWHFEMAEFLKTTDPNRHLVTTSYGNDFTDENVWAHPDIDLTQTHFYINTPNLERALANGNRSFLNEFEKPTLNGEFGLGGSASLANTDPDGIHLHNSIWGSLFGGGLGSAMTWWWDSYIHPQDLYYHFSVLHSFSEEVPFLEKNMRPTTAVIAGVPGDLVLTPTLGWAGFGEADISIDENGMVVPTGAALCQYLYGSLWNTQYRNPPTFNVDFPQPGQFQVKTGAAMGESPSIAIYLDGVLVLQQNGTTGQTYSILVPAGQHTIKVDNLGTDWITIASYSFSGMGSRLDGYALMSEDKSIAAGWVLNNSYNHEYVVANGAPDLAAGGQLYLHDFVPGTYYIQWFDCLTGAMLEENTVALITGNESFPVPDLLWDAAFLIEGEPGKVAARERQPHFTFSVYPNPVVAGGLVSIDYGKDEMVDSSVALLDMSGKEIRLFQPNNTLQLPNELPEGIYWIKLENKGKVGTKAITVVR